MRTWLPLDDSAATRVERSAVSANSLQVRPVIGDRLLACRRNTRDPKVFQCTRYKPGYLGAEWFNETRLPADMLPSIRTADRSVTGTFDARVPLQITIEATATAGLQSEHVQCPPPRYQDNLVAIHGN